MLRFFLSAGILAAMVGAAAAAPKCPPGKIYRVTKKVCVDKAAAIRDGIISHRPKAVATRNAARRAALKKRQAEDLQGAKPARLIDPETTSSIAKPRTSSDGVSERSPAIIVPPVKKTIGGAAAPFGALVDPWSSDSSSALPETRFSLRFATGN